MLRRSSIASKLVLREALPDDLPFASRVTMENMRSYVDRYLGGWDDDKFRDGFHPGIDLIAEFRKSKVGYLSSEVRGDFLFVANLQVDQKFHRRKIGTALMQRTERQARRLGLKGVELHVFPDSSARKFYRSLGYAIVGKAGFLIRMRKEFT